MITRLHTCSTPQKGALLLAHTRPANQIIEQSNKPRTEAPVLLTVTTTIGWFGIAYAN